MEETPLNVTLDKSRLLSTFKKSEIVALINEFGDVEPSERVAYKRKAEVAEYLHDKIVDAGSLVEYFVKTLVSVSKIKEFLPEISDKIDDLISAKAFVGVDFTGIKGAREEYLDKYADDGPVRGLIRPPLDKDFVLKPATLKLFSHLLDRGSNGYTPENVLMIGPQGCGKTETAMQFAAHAGLPLLKLNCALIREPRDWFGYKTAEDGNVLWIRSEFCKLLERGGGVILLDEISRAAPPILNSLMPLLDGTGQTFLEEVKEVVCRAPDLYFFSTANIGNQFTGTYGKLDSALNDRFAVRIECDYLEANKEEELLIKRTGINKSVAKKMVNVATKIRQSASGEMGSTLSNTVSTRNLLDAANLYSSLGNDAFEYTILPIFSKKGGASSQQAQVLQIIQSQFGA